MSEQFSAYTNAMFNRMERVKRNVYSIFSATRTYKSTHQKIIDDLSENIYSTRDYQKLNPFYKGYIKGLIEGEWLTNERFYTESQVFFNGRWYKNNKETSDLISDANGWSSDILHRSAWKDTDKVYFQSKETNND